MFEIDKSKYEDLLESETLLYTVMAMFEREEFAEKPVHLMALLTAIRNEFFEEVEA